MMVLNWSYFLQGLFGIFFMIIALLIWTVGPIIISIMLRNPWLLFTYLVSWMPALVPYFIAKVIAGSSTNGE